MDDNERIKALEHELELLKQKRDLLKQIEELQEKLGMVKERVVREYLPYVPYWPKWSIGTGTINVPCYGDTITVSGSNDVITDATVTMKMDTPFTLTR